MIGPIKRNAAEPAIGNKYCYVNEVLISSPDLRQSRDYKSKSSIKRVNHWTGQPLTPRSDSNSTGDNHVWTLDRYPFETNNPLNGRQPDIGFHAAKAEYRAV